MTTLKEKHENLERCLNCKWFETCRTSLKEDQVECEACEINENLYYHIEDRGYEA